MITIQERFFKIRSCLLNFLKSINVMEIKEKKFRFPRPAEIDSIKAKLKIF